MHWTSCEGDRTVDSMEDDRALVPLIADAARNAGDLLRSTFTTAARPLRRAEINRAAGHNELLSLEVFQPALALIRQNARWIGDDEETSVLPPGEWWAVDAIEGNVNHIHGLPEWAVSVTLVRDNLPVVAVVHQPVGDRTYAAVRGFGATLNHAPLRVSAKRELAAAIATTGQAEAGQSHTYRRVGDSVTAMLGSTLLVRVDVPSTFPLLLTASGQNDVFWQYEPNLSGVAAGILIATEAGAAATSIKGEPWAPGHHDLLVAAPALHAAARTVLSAVSHDPDNKGTKEQ
jgi:myo-inositol-1(or 4)-monophosphatase